MEDPKLTRELTVCDIIGHFGLYQWSLTLFATIYSSLPSLTVIIGPIWTPDLAHLCAADYYGNSSRQVDFGSRPHQCFSESDGKACSAFIYDDANYGTILTNTFDLVCDRQWLRSFISSSALTGMLISSVTLGLLSDKYGRKRMILVGFVISILATISALLTHNYLLLNISYMLMSFAQVGVANALCVLVMEATPPKLRFVAVFEYGIGWGLGQAMVPLVNDLTKNYQHFLLFLLAFQLTLLPCLHWGVFESIRWLISEGDINQAQIELRRACKWNRKQNGAQLAQKIAQVQVQQLRKASCVLETKLAPMRLAEQQRQQQQELQQQVGQELSALSHTIRRSIALNAPDCPAGAPVALVSGAAAAAADQKVATLERLRNGSADTTSSRPTDLESPRLHRRLTALSPTLVRKSFSLTSSSVGAANRTGDEPSSANGGQPRADLAVGQDRQSLTTQALVQLALKHSNAIQQQDEGSSFLVRMFYRKLYKMTLLLMFVSVMLETTYYSLVQANGFVGNSVNLNYYSGAIIEWIGAFTFIFVLWAFNRRLALVVPTLVASVACIGIALTYHLIPDSRDQQQQQQPPASRYLDVDKANITGLMDQPGSLVVNDSIQFYVPSAADQVRADEIARQQELLQLREQINFWLMILGKLSITVAIQIGAVIAMEAYPNNLRQSGSGAIVFVGRIGSILAPFLINDSSPQRTTFKATLAALAFLGLVISALVPCFLPDNKDQELCDKLNEIADHGHHENDDSDDDGGGGRNG